MRSIVVSIAIVTFTIFAAGCAHVSPDPAAPRSDDNATDETVRVKADTVPVRSGRSVRNRVDALRRAYVDRAFERVVRDAEEMLSDSLQTDMAVQVRTLLGRAEQARGRHGEALSALRAARVAATEQGDSVTHLDRALGESLAPLHRWPSAASAFRRVLEARPDDLSARQALAEVYRRSRQWKKAGTQYQRLVRADSTNGGWWARLAQCELEVGKMSSALHHFARAHDRMPQSADVALSLSQLYRTNDRSDAARRVVDTTLTYRAGDPRLWRRKADLAFEQDDLDEAQRAYTREMVVGDSTARALRRVGLIEVQRNQFSDAIPALRESYRINSTHPRTMLYLGISYARVDSLDKAVSFLEQTIDSIADGPIAEAYTNLGAVHSDRGAVKSSVDAYRMARTLVPERTEVIFRLATVYDRHYRQKTTAAQYYRRFLAVSDSTQSELRAYAENRLQSLRSTLHMEGATIGTDSISEH